MVIVFRNDNVICVVDCKETKALANNRNDRKIKERTQNIKKINSDSLSLGVFPFIFPQMKIKLINVAQLFHKMNC